MPAGLEPAVTALALDALASPAAAALSDARATTPATAVESLLITAAALHIRADPGVVDAAEKTLITDPAVPVGEQSSPGMTPPQSAAG